MEVADIRRRVRAAIETARQRAAERRTRVADAAREYDGFLTEKAIPTFRQFAAALAAEGRAFEVSTPAGSVRLSSERSPDDFIELALDDASDPPEVVARTNRGRGRRTIANVQPMRERTPVSALTSDDVLDFLLREIVPLVER